MKAGLYIGKANVQVTDIPMPEIGPEDVLIETITTAVSREDIHAFTFDNILIETGSPFGHETIARVIGFGENNVDFNIGERVYPMSLLAAESPEKSCMLGAFSEYVLVKNAMRGVSLYPIPDGISDTAAALIEPFARGCQLARCGMRPRSAEELYYILKEDGPCRGDIRFADGDSAIVFGADTTALAAAMMLRWFGMEHVTVCDPSSLRLTLAEGFGLDTASSLPADLASYDCWIDTTCNPEIAPLFMAAGKFGSRLVIGADTTGIPVPSAIDPLQLAAASKTIMGAVDFTPADIEDVVGMMAGGYFPIENLVTHTFSPDDLAEALATAADSDLSGQVMIEF